MKSRTLAAAAAAALIVSACSREPLAPPPPGVHLRAPSPIVYYLDKGASDALELAVRESFQLWTEATAFKFSYGGKAAPRVARDGRNQVVLMGHWPSELSIGDAAWTQVYLDAAGGIVEADILLNAQAFSFTTAREARAGSLYIEDVLAAEIGRSLGIGLGSGSGSGSTSGADAGARYRAAAPGDGFEPGIDPAQMAAYLSLYAAVRAP